MLNDLWRTQNILGITLCTILLGIRLERSYGWLIVACYCYSLLTCAYLFLNLDSVWGQLQIRIDASSAITYISIMLIPLVISELSQKWTAYLWTFFTILNLINCLIVLSFGYGIFNASSMDSSMIALFSIFPMIAMLDVLKERGLKWANAPIAVVVLLIPIITIIFTQGSTAYFVLGAGLLGAMFVKGMYRTGLWLLVVCLSLAYLTQGEKLLSTSGRWWHWKMFMDFWFDNANIWIGAGSGSFQWLGPAIQGPTKEAFLFMHNEYLQVLFEQGIIGFSLLMALWLISMWKVRKSAWLFGTFCAASVSMLTQFPLRFFVSQVFIALLIHEAHTLKHRVQ